MADAAITILRRGVTPFGTKFVEFTNDADLSAAAAGDRTFETTLGLDFVNEVYQAYVPSTGAQATVADYEDNLTRSAFEVPGDGTKIYRIVSA